MGCIFVARQKIDRSFRRFAVAAVTALLMVNAGGDPALAQAPVAQTQALSADDFVQAVTTLSMFSQRTGRLAQILGRDNEVRRYGLEVADDQKPLQTLNQGLAAAGIAAPVITALPANQADGLQTLNRVSDEEFDRMFADLQVQAQETALSVVEAYAQAGDNPALKAVAARLTPVFQQRLVQARAMRKTLG